MEENWNKTVYTDWNSESEDILFALRETYGEDYDCLLGQELDALAENYAAEEPEEFLEALGQELTSLGMGLFELETDSDSYELALVPEEQAGEYNQYLKVKKRKGTQKKQKGRKAGTAARRIDLGKRLSCDRIALPPGYRIRWNLGNDLLWLDYSMNTDGLRCCSAVLDISQWPPQQSADMECIVHGFAENADGSCLALLQGNGINAQGILAEKEYALVLGSDIHQIRRWQSLYKSKEENLEWQAMQWFEQALFAAEANCVYQIRDVMHLAESRIKVLELKGGDIRWFPKFFVVGGNLYLFIHRTIYHWRRKKGIFQSGYEFRKVYTIDGFNVWNFAVVDDTRVAFQVRPEYIRRGETEAKLTVLDLTTGKEECYFCHYGYVRSWTGKRVCVLPIEGKSNMPIIECFDLQSGEQRRLMYGTLGKDCVQDIYESKSGTILKGSSRNLYRTTQLWEQMK